MTLNRYRHRKTGEMLAFCDYAQGRRELNGSEPGLTGSITSPLALNCARF